MRLLGLVQLELLLVSLSTPSLAHSSSHTPHYRPEIVTVNEAGDPVSATGRKLTGRFLHITDFHPDPFYKRYSSTEADSACHRGTGPAGFYGAETSDCDSPIALVNATFDWIDENIKDDIDFVIWTGDSARHGNDELLPRDSESVVESNRFMVEKFAEVWGRKQKDGGGFQVPIVANLGNNDIIPHNIFYGGPNWWTNTFLDVWRDIIPEAQRHQFQRGGWFSVEVIPNKLAVVSLNTMYFFTKNAAVDGCAKRSEPGYEHFEWLRIQLQILRDRGMKAILIGHVPPARTENKFSWDETCWQKYTLWLRNYRDVIISSMYGHMNVAHFMLQDFEEINIEALEGRSLDTVREEMDDEISIASATEYLTDLRDQWSELPTPKKTSSNGILEWASDAIAAMWAKIWNEKPDVETALKKHKKHKHKKPRDSYRQDIGGKWAERYAHTYVAASVVPNYFPTMRIFSYNITDLKRASIDASARWRAPQRQQPLQLETEHEDADASKKKNKKHKFKLPEPPSKSTPPGPAYSPQSLSLVSYTQLFANLTHINNDFTPPSEDPSDSDGLDSSKWDKGKHHGKHPHKGKLRKFKFEVEYDTADDKLFGLRDLTVRSWLGLARKIGGYQGSAVDNDYEDEEWVDEDDEVETTGGADAGEDDKDEAEENDDETEAKHLKAEKHTKKHTHKKKHKKHHKHHGKGSKQWFAFVRRAFVETMDPRQIEEMSVRARENDTPGENLELR